MKYYALKVKESHIVPKLESRIRIQEYAVGIFFSIPTKSGIKKAIKKSLILVNHQPTTTAQFLHGGEVISLLEFETFENPKALHLNLNIHYEDDFLAIIEKPAGVLVNGNKFKTIENALPQNLKISSQKDATKPRAVHRLDFPTTGLLLVAKTNSCIMLLNEMFNKKEIKKKYMAISIGKMKLHEDFIKLPIDGKESTSYFKVLNTVPSQRFQYLNLLELTPFTGRRHQLRKHLASIGNPILGDKIYGKEGLILNGKGLYLHAFYLEFIHPVSRERVILKSDLPRRFQKIFNSF